MKKLPKYKNPPKRCAKQLNKLCEIIDEHPWFGMMTLKITENFQFYDEEDLIDAICQRLVYRFRADDLKVGFLMKREFGAGPEQRLHYHIIFTSAFVDELPKHTLDKIEKSWLKILDKPHNQGNQFHWKHPHNGRYLKKWGMGDYDVVSIPPRYDGHKLSPHMHHTRGLGRTAGLSMPTLGKSGRSVVCNEIEHCSMLPVPKENTPYWGREDFIGIKGNSVQERQMAYNPLILGNSQFISSKIFTQKNAIRPMLDFTRSSSEIHTNMTVRDEQRFTQNDRRWNCITCEYEGRHSPRILGIDYCPYCGEPWKE